MSNTLQPGKLYELCGPSLWFSQEGYRVDAGTIFVLLEVIQNSFPDHRPYRGCKMKVLLPTGLVASFESGFEDLFERCLKEVDR